MAAAPAHPHRWSIPQEYLLAHFLGLDLVTRTAVVVA